MAWINANKVIEWDKDPDDIEIDHLPENYPRLEIVSSQRALRKAKLSKGANNIIAFPRAFGLTTAFNSLADKLDHEIRTNQDKYDLRNSIIDLITSNLIKVSRQSLDLAIKNMPLSSEESLAAQILQDDFEYFSQHTNEVHLRVESPQWEIGVNKPHHDRTSTAEPRYCCAYNIAGTLFLRNQDATPINDIYYSQNENTLAYQFGCSTITKHLWADNDNPENNWFIHFRPNTQKAQHKRLFLLTYT